MSDEGAQIGNATTEGSNPEASIDAKVSQIRRMLRAGRRYETWTKFQIGTVVNELKAHREYGARAIEKLEAEFELSSKTLYRLGEIAACWAEQDFKLLCLREGANGSTLTWSHFAALAKVTDLTLRAELYDEALKSGWSSHTLAARVADRTQVAEHPTLEPQVTATPGSSPVVNTAYERPRRWSSAGALVLDGINQTTAAAPPPTSGRRSATRPSTQTPPTQGHRAAAPTAIWDAKAKAEALAQSLEALRNEVINHRLQVSRSPLPSAVLDALQGLEERLFGLQKAVGLLLPDLGEILDSGRLDDEKTKSPVGTTPSP